MLGRTSLLPILAACLGVAFFSCMDAVMKGLSLAIGVYNALLWRSLAGTLMGGAAMLVLRPPWPERHVLRLHLLRGVIVSVMALAFFWGIARLPLAEAIALSFVAPLIALSLAALLLKERIGRGAIIASLLGLAGVAVILSSRLSNDYEPDAFWGAMAILFSAALFAYNIILQRQQAQLASPVEVAFFQNLVILLVLGLPAPFFAALPGPAFLPAILGAAVLAFISLMFLSWAYARAEAQVLIPIEYTAFVWAAILGWLVFSEPVSVTTVTGAALIVTGCIIAARHRQDHIPPVETAAL